MDVHNILYSTWTITLPLPLSAAFRHHTINKNMRANENWRAVPDTNGMYEVSDLGRVRNLRWGAPRLLKQSDHLQGYKLVSIKTIYGWTTRTVHSLVALAFIGPRPYKLVICHRDDDPADNRLVSIRYDTQASNIADAFANGRMSKERKTLRGEDHPRAKLTEDEVRSIKARFAVGDTTRRVAVTFERPVGTVDSIRRGRTWKHIN